MPGLLKKYAKFGFKKGWRLQKAAQAARKKNGKKAAKKTVRKVAQRVSPKTGVVTMARKKRRVSKRGGVRRVYSRARSTKTGRVVMDGSIIAGSMLASTALINMTPVIKTQANWLKSVGQAAVGIVLTNMKGDVIKKVGVGTISGAVVTLALPLVKKWMPDVALFGASRLTPQQLRALQANGMGYPYNPQRAGMGAPYNASRNGNSNQRMARHASNY